MGELSYQCIEVRYQGPVCRIRMHRPEADNSINDTMVREMAHALAGCEHSTGPQSRPISVVVIEGLPGSFCTGADFREIGKSDHAEGIDGDQLYRLWMQLEAGPFVSIAHVRGKVSSGGMGFVASCDVVLADETATFALMELVFELFPACVLPFLVRRIGVQRAHYMTLSTSPVTVAQAHADGLVDAYAVDSEALLRQHLVRFGRLSPTAVSAYKLYMQQLCDISMRSQSLAVAANRRLFSSTRNIDIIRRYVREGKFPWEP